jgi:membrane protease YdiL (CAAX protease family)
VRWWDGRAWTAHAAYPPPAAAAVDAREPFTTLPIAAAWWGLAVTAAALVGARFVLEGLGHLDWPIVVYAVLAAVLSYGPMVLYTRYASRRWGTGDLQRDLGFRFRWADLGWGPVACIGAWCGGFAAALVVAVLRLPIRSNTEGVNNYAGDRGVLIAFLLTAVLVAPVVEELMFRGVVLRGFASVMPAWSAVGLQGVFFGAAHLDPVRGVGNVGLVLVLAAVGTVLGTAAYLLRRIGPTIVAHALYNGAVMAIVLLVNQ